MSVRSSRNNYREKNLKEREEKTEMGTERKCHQKENWKEENQGAEITVTIKMEMLPQLRNDHNIKPDIVVTVPKVSLSP